MKLFLSVVIPAYNEEKNIKLGLLKPVFTFLRQQKYSWEVLFIDDGSTDATNSLLKNISGRQSGVRIFKIKHGGKAAAVRAGMLRAKGEIILFTDLDQSTPISQLPKFIAAHRQGADVVIGVRGEKGTKLLNDTLFRKIRGWVFVKLMQIIVLPDIRDSQCGFKSFKKIAAKKVFSNLSVTNKTKLAGGYMGAWDVEALFLARKFGYSISQVPVDWVKIVSDKLNFWKEPILMFRDLVRIRFSQWNRWWC